MSQITAPAQFNALRNTNLHVTPTAVTTAKDVAIIQASILLAAGGVLVLGGVAVIGIACLVEGALRLGLAVGLRRGARRTRTAMLVLCGFGAFVGWMAGGLGIIGGVVNVVIVRCLLNDEAKEYFNA